MENINKTIWITWIQGWDNAPEISHYCLKSWKYYNPDWNIIQLDYKKTKKYFDVDKHLPGLNTNNISFSDILRLHLLKFYGGVWVDATLFCNKSLNTWIHDINDSFVFTRHDRVLANWFIAAKPNSYILDIWYKGMINFWKYRIKNTDQFEQQYGWPHEIFRQNYRNDIKFKNIVNSWDKIDCTSDGKSRGSGPHLFAPYVKYFYNPISNEIKNRIDSKVDPVYKLSYKVNTDWRSSDVRGIHPTNQKLKMNYPCNSELNYLLGTIK